MEFSKDLLLEIHKHIKPFINRTPVLQFDFINNSITTYIDEDWVKAKNTTLGADNGIGLCISMAIATDSSIKHPPLELLFTVDEETGLTGAAELDIDLIKSNYMLNIDSEENDTITIASAGGNEIHCELNLNVIENHYDSSIKITLLQMQGGHSGMEINKNQGNAIKVIFSILNKLEEFSLSYVNGGVATNAIPKECEMSLSYYDKDFELIKKIINDEFEKIKNQLDMPSAEINIEKTSKKEKIFNKETTQKLISTINKIPTGVIKMSENIDGLVKTSNNLGTIETNENKIIMNCMFRSSSILDLEELEIKLKEILKKFNKVEAKGKYPGWESDPKKSKLLELAKQKFESHYNKKPEIVALHAGLECGIIIGKAKRNIDCISIGPDILEAHTPRERVSIKGVADFYEYLKTLIEELKFKI